VETSSHVILVTLGWWSPVFACLRFTVSLSFTATPTLREINRQEFNFVVAVCGGSKYLLCPRRRHTVGPREPVSGVVFLSLSFDARTELLLGPNNRVKKAFEDKSTLKTHVRVSEAVIQPKTNCYAKPNV